MDDSDIVDLYWNRHEKAIEETASKYGKYCYYIAYNILFDAEDADESVNDTYMSAWNSIPPHRPVVLSAFLGKITRRISLKKRRYKNAEKRNNGEVALALDELSECIPSDKTVDSELDEAELAKSINAFLADLPITERRVFICRYFYLDSIQKICGQFGFGQSKVKSMLYRTRKKLLSYLKKEGVFNEI